MATRNLTEAPTRAASKLWQNTDVTGFEQPPDLLNGEFLQSINAAGTGVVNILRVNSSNAVEWASSPVGTATNAITAFAGGGQISATQLTTSINRVTTVATAADSVKLPAAVAGVTIRVANSAAANSMNIFPASGEIINALSANTAIALAANKTMEFFCAVNGTWNSFLTA